MNKEKLISTIGLLLSAFIHNKKVQVLHTGDPSTTKGFGGQKWVDLPALNTGIIVEYMLAFNETTSALIRIKPESKYAPFTWEDRALFKDRWFKPNQEEYSSEMKAVRIRKDDICFHALSGQTVVIGYSAFAAAYNFVDTGEPCGKLIEE
jgi:hypothetical protein